MHLETLAANKVGREGATPDADVLTAWIVELVDTLATHPAWLKVDGRPVIFAYVWDFAGDDTWRTVRERVRAGGRTPLLMADSTNPRQPAAWPTACRRTPARCSRRTSAR